MELVASAVAAAPHGASWFGSIAPDLALPILQIIWIDLILSGDNAVVIALACRALPPDQRRAGIMLGAGVAVLLRILFAGAVTQMLAIAYLKLAGGILLFWIAVKLIVGEDEEEPDIDSHDRLWRAVATIALADVLMSLDNVIAVAAVAKGSVLLIAFGVALSIPLIIFGSSYILAMMRRFPLIVWLGGALLGWIACDLIASEKAVAFYIDVVAAKAGLGVATLHHAIAVVGAILSVVVALAVRRIFRPGAEVR